MRRCASRRCEMLRGAARRGEARPVAVSSFPYCSALLTPPRVILSVVEARWLKANHRQRNGCSLQDLGKPLPLLNHGGVGRRRGWLIERKVMACHVLVWHGVACRGWDVVRWGRIWWNSGIGVVLDPL